MKIFIIEDEPAIREELVQLLQKYGYQCDSSDDFHHIVQRWQLEVKYCKKFQKGLDSNLR